MQAVCFPNTAKESPLESSMAASSEPPSSNDPADSDGYILGNGIGPNDVLCGRGSRSNHNPGNAAFLGIVEPYLSEYYSGRRKEKQRIAAQILHHVRNNVDPPGRFLARVGSSDMWCLVDDATATEKVKQALRNLKKTKEKARGDHQKRAGQEDFSKGDPEEKSEDQCKTSATVTLEDDNSHSDNLGGPMDTLADNLGGLMDTLPDDLEGLVGASSAEVSVEGDELGGLLDAPIETFASLDVEQSSSLMSTAFETLELNHPSALLGEEGKEEDNAPSDRGLLKSVHIANELTAKIRESHDAGRAYYGTHVNANGHGLSDDDIQSDLTALGTELYKLLTGVDVSHYEIGGTDEDEEATTALQRSSTTELRQTKKRERRADRRAYDTLQDLGLPVSLCILVSSLMDTKSSHCTERYKRIQDVEEDLHFMSIDPDRYLHDPCEGLSGRLELPIGKLYGREDQTTELINTFHRVVGSGAVRELVLIQGYSGTGKSTFVEQLRQPLLQRRGHFISIKFDERGQVQPMSVIFSAFNDFCNDLLEGDKEVLASVRRSLKEAFGADINVLTDLIPSLTYVIGEPPSAAVQVGGKEAYYRLLFYFRLFVRAIASPLHPIIVLLDDLQWADKASLEFVFMTIMGSDVPSLLFAGCYRSNEVGPDHPLKIEIQKISEFGVDILTISLENIDRKSVNALLSDTLHLLPRVTQTLADLVYAKTSGNPLFAVQFLHSLCDQNLLRYSLSSRRWEWDVDAIQAKDIADNVVDIMTQKMLKLNPDVQWLLKVAACLGSRSEASTLKLLSSNDDDDGSGIIPFFDLAVNEGLMSRAGSCYKFSHDQIQQAAYSLISEGERDALHLHIGKVLKKKSTENELKKIVFVVVDQLHRGSKLITDRAEKVEVSRLCLLAGEKAMSSSSFLQASICLLQGSMLLDESDWENNYNLSLELFTCCAEAQYACGNLEGATDTLKPILEHGRCLHDKLRAHTTLLKTLGSLGKLQDAVDHGLSILAQLGEPLPSEPSKALTLFNFAQTRLLEWKIHMGGTSMEGVLNREEMQDTNKLEAMKVLSILLRHAHQVNQQLMALIVLRMVKLSFSHGVCKESSVGFAAYGAFLCAFGQVDQGYRYGKLALAILDKVKAQDVLARVSMVVHGAINFIKEPVQAGLPSFKQGYEVGMSMGAIEEAMTSASLYNMSAIHSGRKLGPQLEEAREWVLRSKEHKHHSLSMALVSCQAILNLIGHSEDPTVLTGEAMDQDELENTHDMKKEPMAYLCFTRMWLAYLFGKYEIAAEMLQCLRNVNKWRRVKGLLVVNLTFFSGLTAVIMTREGKGGDEWRRILSESQETLASWAKHSSWNFQHKLDLLNAEIAFYLNGDLDGAGEAYDAAIHAAGEHGFVHEQALACERAGIFYSEALSMDLAASYFERAKFYYNDWGAERKAEDVPSC